MNKVNNKIIGQIVTQNNQEFILGVFTIDQILRFTKYTKRLIVSYDEDERPIYNEQVQREVETGRVEKIADFLIHDPLASFPTNIVLGIPKVSIEEQEVISFEQVSSKFIEITLRENVFEEIKKDNGDVYVTIIDGQHRIRGIEIAIKRLQGRIDDFVRTIRVSESPELQKQLTKAQKRLDDLKRIELAVTFFIDPSLEYQAMIFSTINRTQRRVSQNLVNSLFGLDTHDTPQKTALEITLSLNTHPSSPFYKRVNLYGGNYAKNQSPPLSQATMIRSIVNLISENPREAEIDRFRKRSDLSRQSDKSTRFLPFRSFYASNQDAMISNILFFYYNAIRKVYKTSDGKPYWDISNSIIDNILQTTVGYEALLRVLCDIMEFEQSEGGHNLLNKTEGYSRYLYKAASIDFTNRDRYPFSTRGRNRLYLEMSLSIFPPGTFRNDRRQERLNELLEEQI
jgi:DGQHR domain-containing protein